MGTINTARVPRAESEKHLNWMGGASYFLSDPVKALRLAASSCFFGEPMYYHSEEPAEGKAPAVEKTAEARKSSDLSAAQLKGLRETLNAVDSQEWRSMTPSALMETSIDRALDHDAEATLRLAVELRDVHNIRTTPQVILVRAANHKKVRGTGLVRRYAREICARGDEPSVGLAYQLARYGAKAPIPNGLKKGWKHALEGFSEYALGKYRMESRIVRTVDVANLVHPKSEAVGKLMKGELSTAGKTWEAIVSSEGSTKESWTKALEVMGHMALLSNLRNITQSGVDLALFRDKLVAGVADGKQLPFRYFSAYRALKEAKDFTASGALLDAVEECMLAAVEGLPRFAGRGMFLCDNSGSAWGTTTSSMGTMHMAEIANLTGIIGGQLCDDGYVGAFGDQLAVAPVRRRSSIFDQLSALNSMRERVGGATENGIWLFWDKAIKEKQHWDNVFVMSDMQAGHGGLFGTDASAYREFAWSDGRHIDVGKLVNKYRASVNPKVNVFLVQVAGYSDTILPEFYDRTYLLGGWSDSLFRFAAEMVKLTQ